MKIQICQERLNQPISVNNDVSIVIKYAVNVCYYGLKMSR